MKTHFHHSSFAWTRPLGLALVLAVATVGALGAARADDLKTVKLKPEDSAGKAGLEAATGEARVDVAKGTVEITVTLPEGKSLPKGAVLEGWLSTAGDLGGPGKSTGSEADQKFGPAFGKEKLAKLSRDIPYALSTGILRRKGETQTYTGSFHIDNTLTPYGAVAVTLETDGNEGEYDPRPGSPLLAGMLKGG